MTEEVEQKSVEPNEIKENGRLGTFIHRVRELPSNYRMALISSWRNKERGLAVFAGVFLASLVITTVLSYGVGLSQIFLATSLEGEPVDAKIEFDRKPAYGTEGWTNNSSVMMEVCDELVADFVEFTDCALTLGRQGIHGGGFFNQDFIVAQPLEMRSMEANENPLWEDIKFNYPELEDAGPPISEMRGIRFMGPGAFDGELADRFGGNIIDGLGEWPSPEVMEEQRGLILPSNIVSDARANVGDKIDSLSFVYVTQTAELGSDSITPDNCAGEITSERNEQTYCREEFTIENLTLLGVYDPWDFGNPTLPPNPVFASLNTLSDEQQRTLIDNDHIYLSMSVNRSLIPSSSTTEAAEWLEDLGMRVGDQEYANGTVEVFYFDIVSGTITFLQIFLGLIQAFDYIIMIPIVVLSIAVLIYGLVLSLEQRRREISIQRVIGADTQRLSGMVLLELSVIAFAGWVVGYILAMIAVPIVLSAVGFLVFSELTTEVNPTLSFAATLFTAFATLGVALLFGRSRTREFIEMEIDEGVRTVAKKRPPRRWLHWAMFAIGMLSFTDTALEQNGSEDGLYSNFFLEGLFGIFGPFFLWIGGALLLAWLGAKGPYIMQFIFGKTALLKDVKRGLKGSGSSESINRLSVIMLLTLSIVTLAAVQGYTGTLVDERTADANVGSEMQVVMDGPRNQSQVETVLTEYYPDGEIVAMTVPQILLSPTGGGDAYLTYVLMNNSDDVLRWNQQAIPGDGSDPSIYGGMTFSAGEEAAYGLGRRSNDAEDIILSASDSRSEVLNFTYNDIDFIPSNISEEDRFGLLFAYASVMDTDLSEANLSNENLSNRDFGRTNFINADLSGANFSGTNLSESIFIDTDITGTNFSEANLEGAIFFSFASLVSAGPEPTLEDVIERIGRYDLTVTESIEGMICPNGETAPDEACTIFSEFSDFPELLQPFLFAQSRDVVITPYQEELRYIGVHTFIPGVPSAAMGSSLIISEESWRSFVGDEKADTHNSTTWIIHLPDIGGEELKALASIIEADSRVSSTNDWKTAHEAVERDGGLIFGTPGLLSLQFVVASIAAVASAFVFLSLVLTQRQKELAILQAIGASPNQIIRLVLFEILSIVLVSMLLGIILGIGVAFSFNGFFDVFGFIFQIFGGTSTVIERELVYPWVQLGLVTLSVFGAVVLALVVTTRRALSADLATVLKGE
ncbi:pentapeptide repeat-containing protein [Candidatus Poseidoniales archaeon]|nr:pentapeptide repeat-containing protein [Candidatus Poseidoniales archaeon]